MSDTELIKIIRSIDWAKKSAFDELIERIEKKNEI